MPDGIGFKEGVKIEKEKWARMNGRERWSYFQTYYLKWTLGILLTLILLGSLLSSVIKGYRTENLFEGALVNIFTSEEGEAYLGDGYLERLGGGKYRKVFVNSHMDISLGMDDLDQYKYANRMKLMSMMSARELDYIMLPMDALLNLEPGGTYADLSECLSEELLDTLSEQLVYVRSEETNELYPAGICIKDSFFAKEYQLYPEEGYLVFVTNSGHLDRAEDFVKYMYWGE